jgi:ubiquinone/menaquinone biosynthesis C-methylase UbiE
MANPGGSLTEGCRDRLLPVPTSPEAFLPHRFRRSLSLSDAGAAIARPQRGSRSAQPDAEIAEQERHLRERYRRHAEDYDRAYANYSAQTLHAAEQAVLAALAERTARSESSEPRILDLACGTGLLSERLLAIDPAIHVVGVDLSDDMLAKARTRILHTPGRAVHSSRVSFLSGRAESIPLAAASVHAVVIANAFHLVREPEAALAECRRVLAPGGALVIVDWCSDFLAMRLLALGLRLTQRLERRVVGLSALAQSLERSGFSVRSASRFRARPAWGMMVVRASLPVA